MDKETPQIGKVVQCQSVHWRTVQLHRFELGTFFPAVCIGFGEILVLEQSEMEQPCAPYPDPLLYTTLFPQNGVFQQVDFTEMSFQNTVTRRKELT